jgi:threonine dehydrogenase-like Zn-dependent dehydrogenase
MSTFNAGKMKLGFGAMRLPTFDGDDKRPNPEAVAAMADGSIQYEGLITHRYPMSRVNEALEMMRDKKEFFTKVMLVND